jgi:mRNA-degrading endonuclease toxin of MazEF toxin-antitoxin module
MKRRPAVVISRDAINKARRTAIVLMSDEWQEGRARKLPSA